ncbi:MAG TPA: Rieske (2Fe-2S) protein [Methylibium sp.]|uniref:Rieske (2Fe-2S) protein n=1 Tax=Methylibium sp. TaxID=2067992 RepID=UPI002DBD11CE|nr:Rieske (2Fe-2S) protein [Methylibium sp.]HEU4460047.1 Rieske (2Fe-2S) protein [Methylibium sp.]
MDAGQRLSASRLGPAAEVPEGGARGYAEAGVFVVRHRGRLHAYLDACPHYGDTPLAWRRDAYLDAAGRRIVCAAHGAQFEIASGRCILGPCLGQSLTAVPIRVNAAGDIEHMTEKETPA